MTEHGLDNDPRVGRLRRELKSSPVFRMALWAEEHSAQLSSQENRRLQDLFKAGIRNVLSSTTTLELGIDIGGLSGVLMSNVPPGKPNYLQRAGRAGRRTDGSSIVVTFIRPRPYDREVFSRFGQYLGRSLRRPEVLLDRLRVARRHAHALLLGEFFRAVYPPGTHVGAMSAFGNMGRFCGVTLPARWDNAEKPLLRPPSHDPTPASNPPWWSNRGSGHGLDARFLEYMRWVAAEGRSDLLPRVRQLFRATGIEESVGQWPDFLASVMEAFRTAARDWRADYEALLSAWDSVAPDATRPQAQANAIRYQLCALYETTVIEALADRQFLPRYGFPIGVHRLRVVQPDENRHGRMREEDQYRLERGGLLALREYVPGSQLLVGGRLITSRGLLKHWTGANLDSSLGLRGQCTRCINDHFYYEIAQPLADCPICGRGARQAPTGLLFPRHGFTTAAWDPPKLSTDVERVGQAERATLTFAGRTRLDASVQARADFAGIPKLEALYREDGELLVYNAGEHKQGFAICLKCGYADSECASGQGAMDLPRGFKQHPPLLAIRGNARCWRERESPVLRNQILAARETTDTLLLDFSACLQRHAEDEPVPRTLGQALLIAGAKLLELDTRELGVMTVPAGPQGTGVGAMVYDNVPGGVGHVRELLALGRDWLAAARDALWVSEEHHKRCDTACLDCLLTFDTQDRAAAGLLKRRLAIQVLDDLLTGRGLS